MLYKPVVLTCGHRPSGHQTGGGEEPCEVTFPQKERQSGRGSVGEAKWERQSGRGSLGKTKWERQSGRGRVGEAEWERLSGRG